MIYVCAPVWVFVCVATAASAPASTSVSATARHTLSLISSLSLSTVVTDVISEHKVRCRHTQWVMRLKHKSKVVIDKHTHTHTAIGGMQSIIVSVRVSVSDNCPLNGFRWIWQLIIYVTCGSNGRDKLSLTFGAEQAENPKYVYGWFIWAATASLIAAAAWHFSYNDNNIVK